MMLFKILEYLAMHPKIGNLSSTPKPLKVLTSVKFILKETIIYLHIKS